MRVNMCEEAFSRHFGVFADSPSNPEKRSLKKVIESTQRVRASLTTTKKPVDSRLVEALAGRDGLSRGHSRPFATMGRGR